MTVSGRSVTRQKMNTGTIFKSASFAFRVAQPTFHKFAHSANPMPKMIYDQRIHKQTKPGFEPLRVAQSIPETQIPMKYSL